MLFVLQMHLHRQCMTHHNKSLSQAVNQMNVSSSRDTVDGNERVKFYEYAILAPITGEYLIPVNAS